MTFQEGLTLRTGDRVRATVSGLEGAVTAVFNGFADVLFDGDDKARAMSFAVLERVPESAA